MGGDSVGWADEASGGIIVIVVLLSFFHVLIVEREH